MPFMPDMSLDDFVVMLDRITGLSIRTLDILGGEPTLHPQIARFVQEAVQRGLRVNISSNGSNTAALENLMGKGRDVTIGVSINDREALERLGGFVQNNGVVVKSVFRLSMDVAFVRDILALRPKKFYLIYLDALDRNDLHETVPFHQFISLVEEQFGISQADTVFCSGFIPDSVNYPELAQVRCPAGTTKLGILPDGSVYPCNLFFGQKEFLLGNILTDPFESVWNHKALTYFRSAPGRDCPKTICNLHTRCHGGCPAHGFAYTGSLSAPDPRCAQ
jgi:radical SAM protein with 4Fe4S-binding SPASM domain